MILLFFLLGTKSSIGFTQSGEANLRKGEDLYFQAQKLFLGSDAQHDVSLQILEESISLFERQRSNQQNIIGLLKSHI